MMLSATMVGAIVLTQTPYRTKFPIPDGNPADSLGVAIHFTQPAPGEVERIANAGFRWVRADMFWDRIEKTKGQFDFSSYDPLVDALTRNGIRAVFILDYGNGAYSPNSPNTPELRQAFCRYVEAVVNRYKGRGILWEMWNEPNIRYWKPKPDVDQYIALANDVGDTIRRVAPTEYYVGPALQKFDWPFLQSCFKAGLLSKWDAVSIHPYRGEAPETAIQDWERLRSMIDKDKPRGRKIAMLCSEWGYHNADMKHNQNRKEDYYLRMPLANAAGGAVLTIEYEWRDGATYTPPEAWGFGLVDENLKEKPAYFAIQNLTRQLAGYRYEGKVDTGDDSYVLSFSNGLDTKYVGWTSKLTGASVPNPVKKMMTTFYDPDGPHAAPTATLRLTPGPRVFSGQ